MRTPKEEREIHAGGYVWNPDGTRAKRMTVYVSDYGYMAKLDRYVEKCPDIWKVEKVDKVGSDIVAKTYSCPVNCISFRSGFRSKTKGTEMPENDADS